MILWTPQIGLVLALLLPLLGAVAILALGARPRLRDAATLVTGALLFADIVPLVLAVGEGGRPSILLGQFAPGLEMRLTLEPLGALFAAMASLLWIVNSVFSIGYMRATGGRGQTRFYAFFALAMAATMGVAASGTMLTLFVFYEALTLSTYPLVAHNGDDAARRGARHYLVVLLATSLALLLPAIVITWFAAGSTDFVPGGLLAAAGAGRALTGVLIILYAFGLAKAALMPVHSWLPAAMMAPTPVSAFLHGVAVVTAGVFAMLKVVVYVLGPAVVAGHPAANVLVALSCVSIVVASIVALSKNNLKSRLAWSTVSQLSFVTLGAFLATPAALMGAAFQMIVHAFAKIALFMCAGAFTTATGLTDASDTRGFGRRMPWLFAAFFVAGLSVTGVPPLAGMWPKLFLSAGAAQAGMSWVFAAIILSTLLNVAYLLTLPPRALFASLDRPALDVRPPFLTLLPAAFAASMTLILFFFAGPIHDYAAPAFGGGQ